MEKIIEISRSVSSGYEDTLKLQLSNGMALLSVRSEEEFGDMDIASIYLDKDDIDKLIKGLVVAGQLLMGETKND